MGAGGKSGRAVVIVSGGAAVSPFTTPKQACGRGLAAGNTDTFLREGLLAAGFPVFTSPARVGAGEVLEDAGWSGFSACPKVLPAELTVNAVGDIDEAGRSLARFTLYLAAEHDVTDVDLVGHSMGGLFSRAAIRELCDAGASVRVRSLTTIGTPWQGSYAADYAIGEVPLSECAGDPDCEEIVRQFAKLGTAVSEGAGEQVTARYLMGADGWNASQAGALERIPTTLIGGDRFDVPGSPEVWPNDGLVQLASALALDVSTDVLPRPERLTFSDVHSIYFADLLGLPWKTALTWDPLVLEAVVRALENAGH